MTLYFRFQMAMTLYGLQSLQRLQRLQSFQSLQKLQRLQSLQSFHSLQNPQSFQKLPEAPEEAPEPPEAPEPLPSSLFLPRASCSKFATIACFDRAPGESTQKGTRADKIKEWDLGVSILRQLQSFDTQCTGRSTQEKSKRKQIFSEPHFFF